MGWAHCGQDSEGREIGYAIAATCDHPGCNTKIDRGLSYACGGMHGEQALEGGDAPACEGYFCLRHLVYVYGLAHPVCMGCAKLHAESVSADSEGGDDA